MSAAADSRTVPAPDDLEDCVLRFRDLGARRATYRPADMALARYRRERYSVVGRPREGTSTGGGTAADTGFSIVYLRCEPGCGVALHGHATPEVFIPMSGRWAVVFDDGRRLELAPFDVITVPPDVMHGLENLSDEPAMVMAINPGHAGAEIRFPEALVAEIRAAGGTAAVREMPGGTARA